MKAINIIKKIIFATLFTFIFLHLPVTAQNDTMYVMKDGFVINKQSIKATDVDSVKFFNMDTMSFVKNNMVVNKQSIQTSDVDSVIFHKPITSCPLTVTDYEGNTYGVVKIGGQCWMAENLKVTHYADETPIPHVTGNSNWHTLDSTDKAYCYYDDDSAANAEIYGALYTWAAVMNGTASSDNNPSGAQGICPYDWHLPSENEWQELENYLIANGYNWDGTTSGDKTGKSLADSSGWNSSSDEGDVGNDQQSNNNTGFTALPGGKRYSSFGAFYGIGDAGHWWSATEGSGTFAFSRSLHNNYVYLSNNYSNKTYGYSVRCVRD